MTQPQGDTDFFISYRGARTDWALWVNWVVRSAGFSTVLMDEFQGGTTWTAQMRDAPEHCLRLIPLYCEHYWESGPCKAEFDAYWQQHMQDENARFVIPLQVQLCTVPKMHSTLIAPRLQTLTRDAAHAAILKALKGLTPVAVIPASYTEPEPVFPGVPASSPVTTVTTTLTWPVRCTSFVPDMANRDAEFSFFADTLCGSATQHATLVSAGSDHGKTRLVSEFHRYGCEVLGQQACSFVDFKGRGTVDNLLDTIASDLGSRIPGLGDRSPSKLREGLRKATQPVLFVFDTFERATEDAREFVETHFLAEMGKAGSMRILLAGQPPHMPDPAKAVWRAYARRFDLGNIPDPKPWVDWAARAFPLIPSAVVSAIAVSAGGAPGAIANQLSTLGNYTATQLAALGIK